MNPIRVGLVGCGLNSENHLRAFSHIKGAQVVAVCDRDLSKAKEKASRYGVKQVFGDFEAMLKKDLDLVDVVTPTSTHAPLSLLALEAGIDTLVEKPMALTSKECLAMIGAAEKSSRTLCILHNFLFFNSVSQTQKMIEDDQLSVSRMRVSHYTRHTRHSKSDAWKTEDRQGGILWEALVHHIYLTINFLGDPELVYLATQKVKEEFPNSFSLILKNKRGVGVCEYEWFTQEPFLEYQVLTKEGDRFQANFTHDFVLRRSRTYKNRKMEAFWSFTDDLYIPYKKWSRHIVNLLRYRSHCGALPYRRSFLRYLTRLIFFLNMLHPSPPVAAEDGLKTVKVLEAAKKSMITGKAQSLT